MVEDVHFQLGWGTPEALGARALTVNLSDIAAMGGKPTVCVVNLAVREGLGLRFFDRMYQGLGNAAAGAGVEVVGGNVTRASALAITIALLGEVRGPRTAARCGACRRLTSTSPARWATRPPDWRILSGRLRARAAARKFLVDRFLQPTARLTAGLRLARITPAPAAIDLSDGLWQDLGHLLERSGAGAEIDAGAFPLSAAYRATVGDDPALALGGGEDYELLFCLRRAVAASALTRTPGRAREPYRPYHFFRQGGAGRCARLGAPRWRRADARGMGPIAFAAGRIGNRVIGDAVTTGDPVARSERPARRIGDRAVRAGADAAHACEPG